MEDGTVGIFFKEFRFRGYLKGKKIKRKKKKKEIHKYTLDDKIIPFII